VADATEGDMDSTWSKLRRRKVVQWGLAYVAVAWGFLQGLEYVSETFQWPHVLRQFALLSLLVGFPIALVIAWYHGDRGEQRVRGTELAIIALLFALGGGVFWWFDRVREGADPAVEPVARPAATADGRPSIAVLPFENRSRLADDAFFVDGIQDDILTQLTKIGAMKVIARTSVEQFRDTQLTTKEIGAKLGVTRVLEGGVQRAGDRVRVTVQLIDPATDAHVWAESYDRELSAANLFAIQSEVATAVALALNARLNPAEQARVGAVPTRSLEAWEAYQLGRQRMKNTTAANLAEAERYLRSAIERDPQFGQAYAALADTLMAQIGWAGAPEAVNRGEAEQLARKAVELAPSVGEAWAALGMVAGQDYRLAEEHYRKAIQLSPNLDTAYSRLAEILVNLGREDEALVYSARAVELSPYSSSRVHSHGRLLLRVGRFEEAETQWRRALEIDPSQPSTYRFLAMLHAYAHNDFVAAVPLALKVVELDPDAPYARVNLAWLYADLDDLAEAERIIQEAREELGDFIYLLSEHALLRFKMGDIAGSGQLAAQALEIDPDDSYSKLVLGLIESHRGNPAGSRSWFVKAYPHLVGTGAPIVDQWDLWPAIELAYVLELTGEPQRARQLLAAAETTVKRMPRLGEAGYGVADAQIHALRGDRGAALAALREAAQAGWRQEWRYYRDHDPAFTSIRQDPEFKVIFADIERDMARQRAELAKRPKPKDAPLDPVAAR
jgi:TolB-like protein/tetratricopeptide (TPR) repeat protein